MRAAERWFFFGGPLPGGVTSVPRPQAVIETERPLLPPKARPEGPGYKSQAAPPKPPSQAGPGGPAYKSKAAPPNTGLAAEASSSGAPPAKAFVASDGTSGPPAVATAPPQVEQEGSPAGPKVAKSRAAPPKVASGPPRAKFGLPRAKPSVPKAKSKARQRGAAAVSAPLILGVQPESEAEPSDPEAGSL